MKAVIKIYPDAELIKFNEIFKPNEGWLKVPSVELNPLNVEKAQREGATHINLTIYRPFGRVSYPDFSVSELLAPYK